jgi:hypothetical protein
MTNMEKELANLLERNNRFVRKKLKIVRNK